MPSPTAPAAADIGRWPSISQAAITLGCSNDLVRWLCLKGRLAYVNTSLGRLIDPDDLERLRLEREQHRQAKRQVAHAV